MNAIVGEAFVARTFAGKVLDIVLSEIREELGPGEWVRIRGFEMNVMRSRSARLGRHPSTVERIEIPALTSISSRERKALKDVMS